MKATSFKTKKIVGGDNLFRILDQYLPNKIEDRSIVVISSKIISICQGRIIKNNGKITKEELIEKEANLILPPEYVRYGVRVTIKNNMLISSAGIDESNGNGYFILWPENPFKSADEIRNFVKEKYKIKNVGVVISDSHSSLLRRGTLGFSLGWSGFIPLKNYIGTPDIFGNNLEVTKSNIVDAVTVTAVFTMGEGNEQTPIAIISDLPNVEFVDRKASNQEIKELILTIDEDVYSASLSSVKWLKGGN